MLSTINKKMKQKNNGEGFGKYYEELNRVFKSIDSEKIEEVLYLLKRAKSRNNTVYIIGNGGSCSTSEHWANDLLKIGGLKAIPLTCLATLTAYANDVSYDSVFVEQLKTLLGRDDVLIGITGSGNSKNIVRALEYAFEKKETTIGILGFDGGQAKNYCTSFIHVPSNDYGILEDIHMSLGHYFTRRLRDN